MLDKQTPQNTGTSGSVDNPRARIAQQIRAFRATERAGKIQDERDLVEYAIDLSGLGATIEHVVKNGQTKRILDRGAGKGMALIDLIALKENQGVTFEGTGLIAPAALDSLAADKRPVVSLTPAEILKVSNDSYDAIFSDFGLGYAEPALAMKRIDQLLAPGGILKFSCTVERLKGGHHPKGLHAPSEFVSELVALGYPQQNIFVVEVPEDADPKTNTTHAIIVAIKPGGATTITAEEVFQNDKQNVADGGF